MGKETPHTIILEDPLSEATRKQRRTLLGVSSIAIFMVLAGLYPTELAGLGIKFPAPGDVNVLLYLLIAIILYSGAMFVFYGRSDWLLLRMHQAEAEIAAERENWERDGQLAALQYKIKNYTSPEESNRLREDFGRLEGNIKKETELKHEKLKPYQTQAEKLSKLRLVAEFYLPFVVGLTALLLVVWHGYNTSNPTASKPPTVAAHQLPTSTEVFHLRSECAQLGMKILDNNIIGRALTQSQVSHYNPKTNRCYVELTVQTADLTKEPKEQNMSTYLYDGQTEELLAIARIKNEVQSGMIFKNKEGVVGDDPRNYIDAIMKDD